jgi:hypothetical protein
MDLGTDNINDLEGVNITNPLQGDELVYNADTGKWENLPTTPNYDSVVYFDTTDPGEVATIFTPNTPETIDTLYVSTNVATPGATWIWDGDSYETEIVPAANNTPLYLYGTTIDAGANKTSDTERPAAIFAGSLGTKKTLSYVSAGNENKWRAIATYSLADTVGDGFKLVMTEQYNGGQGKNVSFDVIIKRVDPDIYVNISISSSSHSSAFDVANFEVYWNDTTKKLTFYYKPTQTFMRTAWAVINAALSTNFTWINTLIGTSLAGQTNDTIFEKNISHIFASTAGGAVLLPTAPATDDALTDIVVRATDGTLKTRSAGTISSSGIWGIADSSGVYTYYATIDLALTAATSGQCVELFADITVATEAVIVLKNGVNINGNGHTLTLTGTTTDGISDNNVTVIADISNITITKIATGKNALHQGASTSIFTGNARISNTVNNGVGLSMRGKASGFFCSGSFPVNILGPVAYGQNFTVTGCTFGYGISIDQDGSICMNSSILSTATSLPALFVRGRAEGISVLANGNVGCDVNNGGILVNSAVKSLTSNACNLASSGVVSNCYFESSAGYGLNNTGGYITLSSILSFTGRATSSASFIPFVKCTFTALAAECTDAGTKANFFHDCHFINRWNNSDGHGAKTPFTGTKFVGCTFELTHASAYAIFSAGSPTVVYAENKLIGSVNFASGTIVQGQISTADAVGNIIID